MHIALQRTRAVYRIITTVYYKLLGFIRQTYGKLLVCQPIIRVCYKQVNYASYIRLSERSEFYYLIEPVQKFRSEMGAKLGIYSVMSLSCDKPGVVYPVEQILRADV